MKPAILGRKYDKIANLWQEQLRDSDYGVGQVRRALQFCSGAGNALDVGCGAGGRMIRLLREHGLAVTGVDVSAEMIRLARQNHPDDDFRHADICEFECDRSFDFILAWDSIFHLPLDSQQPVVRKLCALLNEGGVIIYTFGDAVGEHDDSWHDDIFHYSSIGIEGNLTLLREQGVTCRHLELDQWPQKHVYLIGVKDQSGDSRQPSTGPDE
jgi:SAM-dependent methyltransferase